MKYRKILSQPVIQVNEWGERTCPSTQEQESHHLYLACKLKSARLELERMFYLLLEPLGVLGNEVSHLPEPPQSNSWDGEMLTRVADETNCDKKEVAHNFLLDFRTGREKRSSSWIES